MSAGTDLAAAAVNLPEFARLSGYQRLSPNGVRALMRIGFDTYEIASAWRVSEATIYNRLASLADDQEPAPAWISRLNEPLRLTAEVRP